MQEYVFRFVEIDEDSDTYKLFLKVEPGSYLATFVDKMQALIAANCVETALNSYINRDELMNDDTPQHKC